MKHKQPDQDIEIDLVGDSWVLGKNLRPDLIPHGAFVQILFHTIGIYASMFPKGFCLQVAERNCRIYEQA